MNYHEKFKRYKKELKKLQKSPIKMIFEFGSSQDERVCSQCAALNGTKMDVLKAIVGVNHPPLHEGCRCVPYYTIDGIRNM